MEETKIQSDTIQEDNGKWVSHYSSDHQILLVGEGDFSFSLSLARSFGSAFNIVASSLNSYDDVTKMYKHAKSNLDDLRKLGACLLHGVDATKMKHHSDLKMRRFDRVVFNFPHAGFHRREDNKLMIKMHKTLLLGFFNNANHMLRANGEIHVSHKTTAPFSNWNLENLAAQCFLTLIECTDFNREDYPGYNNKRGDGYRCDEPFPLGKCSTYKFVNTPKAKRKPKKRNRKRVSRQQINLPIQEIEDAMERLRTSAHLNYYPKTSQYLKMKDEVTSVVALNNRHTSVTGDHLCSMAEAHRRGAASCGYSALGISLGPPRTLQPTAEPLQSWQPWPAFTNALTGHVRTMETVPMLPLDTPRTSQPVQPLQSLHPWPTSNNVRYSLTDEDRAMETVRLSLDAGYRVYGGRSNYLPEHVGTMHTVPLSHDARNGGDYQVYGGRSNYLLEHGGTVHTVPLSHGARNEGDYQVYGGCSNYWQQELGRITNQRASYSLDRYIGQVPGKSVQSELHRINILMSERRRLFVKS